MYDAQRLWGRVASEPVFVLTSDQDWAPEWAITTFLKKAKKWDQPLHVFRTSPSAVLDAALQIPKRLHSTIKNQQSTIASYSKEGGQECPPHTNPATQKASAPLRAAEAFVFFRR